MKLLSCGATGQLSFMEGFAANFGYSYVALEDAVACLESGETICINGGYPFKAEWATKFPRQIYIVWHTGWTGTGLLGEGDKLGTCVDLARKNLITLFWLEQRDVLPENAIYLPPVWTAESLQNLKPVNVTKEKGSIVAALHGDYPTRAKNIYGAFVAALASDAAIVHSGFTSFPARTPAPFMSSSDWKRAKLHALLKREECLKVVASADLLVHPSLSDTWPYFTMESVYVGTPVVGTDTIYWMRSLPDWAFKLCVTTPNDTLKLKLLINGLLKSDQLREDLLNAQRSTLDNLQKENVKLARQILQQCKLL